MKCRYLADRLAKRCNKYATEMHPDKYYGEPHPVCKEHKKMLVAADRKAKRAAAAERRAGTHARS